MSQYPSPLPYGSPVDFSQFAGGPASALLAPARRAALLQGIIGCLMIVCGVGIGAVGLLVPESQIVLPTDFQVPELPPGMSAIDVLRIAVAMVGGCGSIAGVVLLCLCFFVRKGGAGAAITSIVVEVLICLILVFQILSSAVQLRGNLGTLAMMVLIFGVPLGLLLLNIALLVGAARNSSRIGMVSQQFQSQFFQYQQQQQAYGQPMGYGAPPIPPGYGYGYGYPQGQPQQLPSQAPMPQVTPAAPTQPERKDGDDVVL